MAEQNTSTNSPFKRIWEKVSKLWKKETNVYFISGMCYNCKVFDKLRLPKGFKKQYIEWHIPRADETLREYAKTMAKKIDTRSPFILVGYSFGAVIMQEMSYFLSPQKSVIISSFKKQEEIPLLFRAVKRINLINRIPESLYSSTDFVTNAFNQMVYHMPTSELAEYMTYIDPIYIKWAVTQITHWIPDNEFRHLYHIHGTEDQIFPYENIQGAYPVEDGDHLMVLKKAGTVSSILASILLMK
ncbi:MAG: alpha/beta hydrolase [Dysgonomonas sp.]|nr:alpha/beta hydrolase [Dysgonomonas sp.]